MTTPTRRRRPRQDHTDIGDLVHDPFGGSGTTLDSWLAGIQLPDGSKRVLIAGTTLELAQGVGEDYVRRHTPGGLALVASDAAWRSRPPSPKALAAAKRWRLPVERGWTAGQLSDALDAHIARCKAKRPAKTT